MLKPAAHLGELARVGALEAEDRLLGIADSKDRAHTVDRALPREEFAGEATDHLPLVGVGVLSLVDQNVVEAAVELVEHPGCAVGVRQQPACGDDQIVIVEGGAPSLGDGIARADIQSQP